MGRPLGSKNKPAEGGAVGSGEQDIVRGPIKDMLAGGSEEDFKESLPDQTSTADANEMEPRPKRTYKKREKKDEAPQPVDKRLERAQAKQSGLGLAGLTSAGFAMSGKPLTESEDEDVSDQFYLISKKAGANNDSWVFIIGYTIALICKLILIRTEFGEEFQAWMKEMFRKKEKDAKQQEPTRK